eukprot:TRINITY_DN2302_c0_g1_i7.p1 TRINITY_DN2302_c0_g1~~TRINITY_DN2302_c0_g1_i7.p1  ORF type:complete len:106 (-),score=11.64 TRINITY_DN2302_c0_g1_i7:220-537(-)
MNIQQFVVENIEVPRSHIQEVLHCFLHSIMFTRAFGLVKPNDVYIDSLDLYYAKADDGEIEKKIKASVDSFIDNLTKKKLKKSQAIFEFNFIQFLIFNSNFLINF